MPDVDALAKKYGLLEVKPRPQASHVPGLLVPGNIDLTQRPNVKNPDGSMSSVYSMGIEDENPRSPYYGKQVLIPGVIPNGQGGYYTDTNGAAARRHYYATGEHMGVFSSPEASDRYGEQVHNDYVAGKYGTQYKEVVEAAQDQDVPVKSHVPQPPHPMAVSHEHPKAQPIPEPQP